MLAKKTSAVLILVLLMLPLVLISPGAYAVGVTAVGPISSDYDGNKVGDWIWVNGTSTTPGGLIKVYWDSVKDWDGKAGYVAEKYAVGTSFAIKMKIPDAIFGDHWIIVKDVEVGEIGSWLLAVQPKLSFSTSTGLPGETISVTGTGFNGSAYVSTEYTNTTGQYKTLTTSPIVPKTSDLGRFTCTFVIPSDAQKPTCTIRANTTAVCSKTKTLTVGPYIKLTPSSGFVATSVSVVGKGFTAGGYVDIRWYMGYDSSWPVELPFITLVDDYPIDSNGAFTLTIIVPLVPDPIPPYTRYSVWAVDSNETAVTAHAKFDVKESPAIELSKKKGKAGTDIQVTGTWFTADREVIISFGTVEVAKDTTDSNGGFVVYFKVPDVPVGVYIVMAKDAEAKEATAKFTVVVAVVDIKTRATLYYQGDTLSIYANTTESLSTLYYEIVDPNGIVFAKEELTVASWTLTKDGDYVLPYKLYIIPSDAPLGDWNFTAWETKDKYVTEDTNLFTVMQKPTYDTVLTKLSELDAKLAGLIKTSTGEVKAYLDTKLGPVVVSLTDLNAKLVKIEGDIATVSTKAGDISGKIVTIQGDVATIKTTVGEIKVSATGAKTAADAATAAATSAKAAVDGMSTPLYAAVILALIAAVAAAASVIQLSRKIAG